MVTALGSIPASFSKLATGNDVEFAQLRLGSRLEKTHDYRPDHFGPQRPL
jgi:hypothetical protein